MNESPHPEDDKLIPNHEYDGIQELDNPLPGWWLGTFYITVVVAVIYFAYYILGSGPTLVQELEKSMQQIESVQNQVKDIPWPNETELLSSVQSSSSQKLGGTTFQSKCSSCHGQKGEGGIGPNLTDRFWIHGKGTPVDIAKVIRNGVSEKGMPNWGGMLKDEEIYQLVGYVISLKGSNPPNSKAAQGEEVK